MQKILREFCSVLDEWRDWWRMNENQLRCLSPAERASALAELRRAIQTPPTPVPVASLQLLYDAACMDTGGSQATRSFLFWLAGEPDPTGFVGDGGLELRRLDRALKCAAFEVITWWAGPTKSDRPLYDILAKLQAQFAPEDQQTDFN